MKSQPIDKVIQVLGMFEMGVEEVGQQLSILHDSVEDAVQGVVSRDASNGLQ